jgi:hypothetical protein
MSGFDVDNVTVLMEAWKVASVKFATIKADIESKDAENAAAEVEELKKSLTAAEQDEDATKTTLFDELSKRKAAEPDVDQPTTSGESSKHSEAHTTEDSSRDDTRLTARMVAPKEYKHGENFTTWCSRFKRYYRASRLRRRDAFELLLNSVDDRTLEKIEPVADKLTTEEAREPDLFIPIFEQAIYPKSDIRSLRQQLTNGNLWQEEDEDVDTFASRIRSLAKRAYSKPAERHEPCLNAFLNGMKDPLLFDKVVSVPGAEDDFELAVESARKFEKLRRPNRHRTSELDVLRVSENQNRGGSPQEGAEASQRHTYRHDRRMQREDSRNDNRRSRQGQRSETRKCYLCQEKGHIVANCPLNPLNPNRAGNNQNVGPQQ